MAKNIKTRAEDYAQWYLDVIKAAQLADYAPVKGCMVIRPEGYAIWEAIQRELDRRFKDTGHVNGARAGTLEIKRRSPPRFPLRATAPPPRCSPATLAAAGTPRYQNIPLQSSPPGPPDKNSHAGIPGL